MSTPVPVTLQAALEAAIRQATAGGLNPKISAHERGQLAGMATLICELFGLDEPRDKWERRIYLTITGHLRVADAIYGYTYENKGRLAP